MKRLLVLWLVASSAILGCDTKVEQARPPRIPDDPNESGKNLKPTDDIAAEPEKTVEPVILTPEMVRHKCATECSKAMANDRTGDTAEKIPCTDFTADMSEECLKWFRKTPMKAVEAQKIAAEPAPKPKQEEEE